MKAMWTIHPELLSWETCNEIISHAQKIKPVQAVIGANKEVNEDIRSSTLRWVDFHNDDFKDVFRTIERVFVEDNAVNFGVDLKYLPSLQFTTYHEAKNGHYDWHVDVFWESNNLYDRKLSMVIQLTDPNEYEGGNLEFSDIYFYPDAEQLRKRGTVIVFPSFVKHRVTPVTKGVRHSMVAWMQGPPWR